MADSWEAVEAETERLIAEHVATLDRAAGAQIREFLAFIRRRAPVPDVGPGYWCTSLRFTWRDFEVEVFDDRLEVYRFPDQQVDVRYFERAPGGPFATDLAAELEALRA